MKRINYKKQPETFLDYLIYMGKLAEEAQKPKRRKKFSKWTRQGVLFFQNNRCKRCGRELLVVEFDHIDGDRTNNLPSNCQALCPTCHALKSKWQKMGFSF